VARHQNHFSVGLVGLRSGQNAQSVDIVHHQIGNDDVEGRFLKKLRALVARGGHAATTSDTFQAFRHGLGVCPIVIDD